MRLWVIVGWLGLSWFVAGWVHADTIGLYADSQGVQCNLVDTAGAVLPIYVVHVSSAGSAGCQFSAPKPACMVGAIWLTDVVPFFELGNTQVGVTFGYGTCKTGPIHVTTMIFFGYGTSEPCCQYPVLPDPYAPQNEVLVVECDNEVVAAGGLVGIVNGNASCPCGYPVAVEETTWGNVKALYQE